MATIKVTRSDIDLIRAALSTKIRLTSSYDNLSGEQKYYILQLKSLLYDVGLVIEKATAFPITIRVCHILKNSKTYTAMSKTKNRTISHIYSLDIEKSSRLVSAIAAGTMRTTQCVYYWMLGRRKPCFLEQKFIREKVSEIYGMDIPLEELFPQRTNKITSL